MSLFEEIDFEDFYKLYPRKVGKADARKAWDRLAAVDKPVLMSRLPEWLKGKDDPKYLPHPATWLRARRWEDEQPVDTQIPTREPQRRSLWPWTQPVTNLEFITDAQRQENIKKLRDLLERITADNPRARQKAKVLVRTGKWAQ